MDLDDWSVAAVRARVARHLARFVPLPVAADGLRRAAVCVCLVERRGAAHVVVIKRGYGGRNAGQWALPGGRLDGDETPVEAALRELSEEIGLAAAPDDVVGVLDDFRSGAGYVITPVVVFPAPQGPPRRNPAEVHSVHPVPASRLVDPALPRWREQPDGAALLQMPLRRDMVIHAPTGAILWQFREVALLGRTRRVADAAEPSFVVSGAHPRP